MRFSLALILVLVPVLVPHAASAAVDGMDFTCASVENLEPVSPYVKQVLERADVGLEFAKEAGAATDFLSILPGWATSMASAWAGLTDTTLQRTDSIEELAGVSACLHLDLTLIDCKIEEVRQEMRAQTARGSFISIIRLTSLLQFLNERARHLTAGALDPQYPDPSWGRRYAFDRPDIVWCVFDESEHVCEEINEDDCLQKGGSSYETLEACTDSGALPPDDAPADNGRLCPFSADYAPAFDSGFGCDIETMEPRQSYPPVKAELDGLKAISGSLAAYRETAAEVLRLQQQMSTLFGTPPPTVTPPPAVREHLDAFGCGWMGGWCSGDDEKDVRCTSDKDCEETCAFSNKLCEKNRAIRCTDDEQCEDDDKCIDAIEPPLRSIRGNFSLDRDQIAILSEFLNVRSRQEISRVFRSDLQTAAELPADDQDLREERAREDSDPAFSLFRSSIRLAIQTWSRIQARGESLLYPEVIDAPLESAKALGDLHTNISEIARLASDKSGLRDFVTRYAWFMQRSCIYRPCSLLLEQVIRLTTTDECFPYANGEYLSDTENNPRWEKCKDAAEIE
jgi:hypothetical protein